MSRAAWGWSAFQLSNSFSREFISPQKVKINLAGGFPYEAFNGVSQIKPWSILSLVESSRCFSFNGNRLEPNKGYLDCNILYQKYFLFIASLSLKISPDVYNREVSKAPLCMTQSLIYAGNSTFCLLTEITHADLEVPLVESKIQTVCVDKVTRKPHALPDDWKQKYQQFSQPDGALNWRLSEPCPADSISYPLVIQPSDCDGYSHINWTNYLKFCFDAYVGSGFKSGNQEMKEPQLQSAYIAYIKEGKAGEELSVNFWENTEKEHVSFEIFNEKKDTICQAQLKMYHEADLKYNCVL